MGLPATSGCTRDRPAASGQARRRLSAASAASSVSRMSGNDVTGSGPGAVVSRGTFSRVDDLDGGTAAGIVPRGTFSRVDHLDEGASAAKINVPVFERRKSVGRGEREDEAAGPAQARAQREPRL